MQGYRLQKTYFDVEKLSGDKNDAEEAVREAYQDAYDVSKSLGEFHPYLPHAKIILDKVRPRQFIMLHVCVWFDYPET